jgi:carboxymethylenebutenolidase
MSGRIREDLFRGLILLTTVGLITACGGGNNDYADRMATEHEGDRPVASGAASVEPTGEIEEQVVEYATVGGKPVAGFLARPAGAPQGAPAIIVIQEWWGLNDNIRSMARRLAGEGYVALAVDLYEGNVADTPERARELMMASMEREDALEDNLRQAYAYLDGELGSTRIGSIGWCFGGGWSLRTALLFPEDLDAAVIYYGRSITDRDRLASLQVPLLGIFGAEDQGIPLEGVREFESVLKDLGKDAEIHVYDGADHAFANPSGTRFNAEAAEDAWAKTLAFLKINLGS